MKAKIVKVVKSLNVELTEEEFKGHAVELAKLMSERDRIENRMTSMRSQLKAEIDEVVAKINRERTLVQTGREWRDVSCAVTYDYDAKRVTTAAADTGEIIEDRAMRLDEMQVEMDFDGEPEQEDMPEPCSEEEDLESVVIDRVYLPRVDEMEGMTYLVPRGEDEDPYCLSQIGRASCRERV